MRTVLPGRPPRARGLAGTLLLSLALIISAVLSGCSDESRPSTRRTATHVVVTTPAELATTAEIGRIVGRLPGTRRKSVRKEVTRVVDRWWEAAYLSTDRASAGLSGAFPGFTAGARRRATYDRELMTNADLAADSLTPLMRKVRLDLLAVNARARSVTARFDLRVRTTGERTRRLQVRGRLFLTRSARGWQVFGYDVSKGWL
ncbi:hypothetical protein [Nocardioides sp.]|uniref:hypothetical protein n=1 Tax=Nocardioides sp. TaxID=35761 RepID=UPI00286DB1A0|nr:hypothetical protein [Nocardioides sp.]